MRRKSTLRNTNTILYHSISTKTKFDRKLVKKLEKYYKYTVDYMVSDSASHVLSFEKYCVGLNALVEFGAQEQLLSYLLELYSDGEDSISIYNLSAIGEEHGEMDGERFKRWLVEEMEQVQDRNSKIEMKLNTAMVLWEKYPEKGTLKIKQDRLMNRMLQNMKRDRLILNAIKNF